MSRHRQAAPERRSGGYTEPPAHPRRSTRTGIDRVPPEDHIPVQLRVITDQPWDVPADVLVIPIAAKPIFDGPLSSGPARRRRAQASSRSARGPARRYSGAARPAGQGRTPHGDRSGDRPRSIASGRARRGVGRAPPRRPTSQAHGDLADPLADGLAGDFGDRRRTRRRGVLEGSDPGRSIARRSTRAADPRRAPSHRAGRERDDPQAAAERGIVIAEGAASRTCAVQMTSARSSLPEARASPKTARPVDRRHRTGAPPSSGWACSWPSAGQRQPPRMIVGEEEGARRPDRHLARRQGVCFGSGGSASAAARMEEMKMDKTGACTAAIAAVARWRPAPLLAVARRSRQRTAFDPAGGIVTALSGKRSTSPAPCRGSADPGAAMIRRAARRDPRRLRRDPDRAVARSGTWSPGRSAGLGLHEQVWPRALGPASAAGSPSRRPHVTRWTAGTATSRTRLARGSRRRLPARVRDAVGPPRHRRDGLYPSHPFSPRARPAPRDPGRTRLAGAGRLTRPPRPPAADHRPPDPRPTDGAARRAAREPAARWALRPTGSRPAGPITMSIRGRAADGGPPSARQGARLGLLRCASERIRSPSSFGAWFITLVVGLATDLDQHAPAGCADLPVSVALVYALVVPTRWSATRSGSPSWPRSPSGPALPAVDPVRCRGVRPRRREAADRGRPARRWRPGARLGHLRADPGRDRPGRAAGDPPDRSPDVHPVRTLLHHRAVVGGLTPDMRHVGPTGTSGQVTPRAHPRLQA